MLPLELWYRIADLVRKNRFHENRIKLKALYKPLRVYGDPAFTHGAAFIDIADYYITPRGSRPRIIVDQLQDAFVEIVYRFDEFYSSITFYDNDDEICTFGDRIGLINLS